MNSLICIYDYQTCYDGLEKPLMNDLRILCWVENDPTYLADFLLGMVSAKLNSSLSKGGIKEKLVRRMEKHLGKNLEPTYKTETKFNIFKINLQGGW